MKRQSVSAQSHKKARTDQNQVQSIARFFTPSTSRARHLDSSPNPASQPPSGTSSSPIAPRAKNLTQTVLSLGQTCVGLSTCRECGLPNNDPALHTRYHASIMGGVDYKGYTSDTLVHSDMSTNASIILITYATASPTQRKKFMQIVAVMNAELGAIGIDDGSNCNSDELTPLKLFIFVVKAKVVGSLLVEPIKHAFRLGCVQAQAERSGKPCDDVHCLNSTDRAENKGNTGLSGVITPPCECKSICASNERAVANSSLAVSDNERQNGIKCKANSSKRDENAENANLVMAIESNSPVPAACGISRIWVSKKHRRHGIAIKLLDACRRKYLFGCVLDKESIAFSQPTMEGMRLGRKFFGRPDFLVYAL